MKVWVNLVYLWTEGWGGGTAGGSEAVEYVAFSYGGSCRGVNFTKRHWGMRGLSAAEWSESCSMDCRWGERAGVGGKEASWEAVVHIKHFEANLRVVP